MKCKTCGAMNCMAHGGNVRDENHEKGVHPRSYSKQSGGISDAGNALRDNEGARRGGPFDKTPAIKDEHRRRLGESKEIKPKLQGLAEGGEVEPNDMDDQAMNDEINDMIVDELQQAFDQKDKKGILESLRALVLSCDKD